MSSALERQRNRRAKLQEMKKAHAKPLSQKQKDKADLALSSLSVDETDLSKFLNPIEHDLEVRESEINELLDSIRSQWKDDSLDTLINSIKNSITTSIAIPFGLGALVSHHDKEGGNVTTIHNAQQGIFANEEDKYRRKDYTDSDSLKKFKDEEFIKNGDGDMTLIDRSSGNLIGIDDADVDHVISAEQMHNKGGFMLDKSQKKNLGKAPENLAILHKSANRSKGSKSYDEFHNTVGSVGISNKERYGHDKRRTNSLHKKAENHLSESISLSVQSEYYVKNITSTGVDVATKNGFQHSLGLLLNELLISVTDEMIDIYRNGLYNENEDSIIQSIKTRFTRIADRVASKWKDALEAFQDGAISGFISNLVTVLINMFVKTLKDIGRLIRDGFFIILKALKIAFFPPDGLRKNEAYDAALKILTVGLTSLLGIAIETILNIEIGKIPIINGYSGVISSIVCGALTGVVSALLVYKLEQMDIFGVNSEKRHQFVMEVLEKDIKTSEMRISKLLEE